MVRPSNPKLMARVLEAVDQLGEGKGSLARDVLKFVKENSEVQPRNLTMQVRKALKHAVAAGLLRCKSNRYKMQLDLNQVSRRKRYDNSDDNKNDKTIESVNDELPQITNAARKSAPRIKRSSRKRSGGKAMSRRRGTRSKLRRRRGTTVDRRSRTMGKRPRRKTTTRENVTEDWPTRKRRMMAKSKYKENEAEEDEDEEEEEEEENDDYEGRDEQPFPKMKSVNEDRYSDFSGDSVAVGRHRSRRSKHLARVRSPSPSKRGNGDADGHRKSSRRSNSKRRRSSQPRQRDIRQIPSEEPLEDEASIMQHDQTRCKDCTRMDEDQAERSGTPPDNQPNE